MTDETGSNEKNETRGRLKRIVAGAAPQLAQALGGPLAGAAVATLSRVVFGEDGADDAALESALSGMSAGQVVALRRAEAEFLAAVREAAVEEARTHAADRADARARHREMQDWTPCVLGGLIIAGFFVVLAAMVARRLPQGTETEFSIMLGALATMTAAVVNYFFGSSAGSKEKTRMFSVLPPGLRRE